MIPWFGWFAEADAAWCSIDAAVGAKGTLVVWNAAGSVQVALLDRDGLPAGEQGEPLGFGQGRPGVGWSDRAGWLVAYGGAFPDDDVTVQRFDRRGARVGEPATLALPREQGHPRVVGAGDGWLVLFDDCRSAASSGECSGDRSERGLTAVRVAADGSFGEPLAVAERLVQEGSARALSEGDTTLVAWGEAEGPGRVRRLGSDGGVLGTWEVGGRRSAWAVVPLAGGEVAFTEGGCVRIASVGGGEAREPWPCDAPDHRYANWLDGDGRTLVFQSDESAFVGSVDGGPIVGPTDGFGREPIARGIRGGTLLLGGGWPDLLGATVDPSGRPGAAFAAPLPPAPTVPPKRPPRPRLDLPTYLHVDGSLVFDGLGLTVPLPDGWRGSWGLSGPGGVLMAVPPDRKELAFLLSIEGAVDLATARRETFARLSPTERLADTADGFRVEGTNFRGERSVRVARWLGEGVLLSGSWMGGSPEDLAVLEAAVAGATWTR